MSYLSLFICREKGIKRGSLRNERTRFAPFSVTTESSRCLGGWGGGGEVRWGEVGWPVMCGSDLLGDNLSTDAL